LAQFAVNGKESCFAAQALDVLAFPQTHVEACTVDRAFPVNGSSKGSARA